MDSYNSKYPIEYYEIGTPYMFYTANLPMKGEAATLKQVEEYESILEATANQKGGGYSSAIRRCVGVVVDKESHGGDHPYDDIKVMFRATIDGNPVYVTVKYIVGYQGVFCDDKEQIAAAGSIDLTGKINLDFSEQQAGDPDDIGRGRGGGGNGDDLGRREKGKEDLGRHKKA